MALAQLFYLREAIRRQGRNLRNSWRRRHVPHQRSFTFEPLENRVLLSASPVAMDDVYTIQEDSTLATGTALVADINTAKLNSSPRLLTDVNGTLFFAALDEIRSHDNFNRVSSQELWKSDGTEAGTVLVKVIEIGDGSAPGELINVNGALFFTGSDNTGYNLWKSDGTESGTVLVKDISDNRGMTLRNLTNVDGTVFFAARDGVNGWELWKSDGTEAGTVLVRDIWPNGSASPDNLTNVNGILYFTAEDGINGLELWKRDGTESGTVLVKDIVNGMMGSNPWNLTNSNGTLYFTVDDGFHGQELWKSDGTEAGTVLVKDIQPGAGTSVPTDLTNVNGTLFFAATDGVNGWELWKGDGTAAGTELVKDINLGLVSSSPNNLTDVNGVLYFTADDGVNGWELWKSDGTAAGTGLVKDINLGLVGSSLNNLMNINGTLFFTDIDGTGYNLWKSDGTETGTVLVKNISAGFGPDGSQPYFTSVDGTLFFRANDPMNGVELWKSDGTEVGTGLVKDIRPNGVGTRPVELTNINGSLFFFDAATRGLWKSTGTEAGTVLLKTLSAVSSPNLTDVNGMLFFGQNHREPEFRVEGQELWKSDGTESGTVRVKVFLTNIRNELKSLTNVDGTLFLVAQDAGENGYGLWKSDGTESGTVLVKDFSPNSGALPDNLINVNGTLYFTAEDGINGRELWKSDRTESGTVLVKDIWAGGGALPDNLINVNGTLYFTAEDGINGRELWKSVGTESGTVLVKDIWAGGDSASFQNLTNVNGTLFFVVDDGVHGLELWASGTSILANDSDIDSPTLTAQLVSGPSHGTLQLSADGSLTYRPDADFAGTDSFSYQASDGIALSNLATVTITVESVNDAPVVNAATFSLAEASVNGTVVGTPVTFTDPETGQTHTFAITAGNTGEAFAIDAITGQLTVLNSTALGFYTTPSFTLTVQVTDNGTPIQSGSATVTINLQDVLNVDVVPTFGGELVVFDAPIGTTITATTIETPAGAPAGVTFPEGTFVFTMTGVMAGPTTVTLTLPVDTVVNGYWKYGPEAGNPVDHWYDFAWDGTTGAVINGNVITLTFVDGGRGDSDLTINGVIVDPGAPVLVVNRPPTLATIADRITKMGTAVTFTALGNDVDLPAQSLLYSLATGAPTGATINSTTGVLSWTPTETVGNNPGQFAITVVVSDGQLTAAQTYTVTVNQNSIVAPYMINGTNGNDIITIMELPNNVVRVSINGTTTNVTLAAGREIQVYALNGNDLVNLVGLTRPIYVEGGNGNDVIQGLLVTNTAAVLWLKGGEGFDTLTGGVALDHLDGGMGNDLLSGGFGNDILYGREGFDTLFGNGGMDILLGDSGNDRLEGGDGDDYLSGGSGNDTLLGQNGDDILVGGDDNDVVEGGGGHDMIDAGAGNDIVRGGAGNDLLLGGLGNDNVQGEAGNDRIAGQGGLDTINGGSGTDQAVTPASGSPVIVSIETVLANETALLAAATAAKQAWVVRFVSGLPVNSPIDDEDVINIVLT